jgi:predicted homoserine dehydrogenase-like protein
MLQKLAARDHNIRIVIVGIGSVGNGLVFQSQITKGIDCVAIADIKIEKAIACAEFLGRDYQVVDTVSAMHEAIIKGKLAVSNDGQLVARCELADVLIDSTNAIAEAALHGITALEYNKHLIMMNYEADLTYGPLLLSIADAHHLIYTCCDGDQPAVIKRIVDDLQFWGFDLVLAGNIKGYLDRYANPTTIIPEADKRNLDYRMCTSYTDGTKLSVEMAVLANALGLQTAVPGMIGPRANHVQDVFKVFDLDALMAGTTAAARRLYIRRASLWRRLCHWLHGREISTVYP